MLLMGTVLIHSCLLFNKNVFSFIRDLTLIYYSAGKINVVNI